MRLAIQWLDEADQRQQTEREDERFRQTRKRSDIALLIASLSLAVAFAALVRSIWHGDKSVPVSQTSTNLPTAKRPLFQSLDWRSEGRRRNTHGICSGCCQIERKPRYTAIAATTSNRRKITSQSATTAQLIPNQKVAFTCLQGIITNIKVIIPWRQVFFHFAVSRRNPMVRCALRNIARPTMRCLRFIMVWGAGRVRIGADYFGNSVCGDVSRLARCISHACHIAATAARTDTTIASPESAIDRQCRATVMRICSRHLLATRLGRR